MMFIVHTPPPWIQLPIGTLLHQTKNFCVCFFVGLRRLKAFLSMVLEAYEVYSAGLSPSFLSLHGSLKDLKDLLVLPKIVVPQNGWFIMENPIKMGWFGGKTHYFRKHPLGGSSQLVNAPRLGYVVEDHPPLFCELGKVRSGHFEGKKNRSLGDLLSMVIKCY